MWIKICGITQIADARVVVSAGASAIGLNFYPGSKRFISVDQALAISRAVRGDSGDQRPLDIVGVFVNSMITDVEKTSRDVSLTAVQFHGDESASEIEKFHQRMPEVRIIRAVRISIDRIDECLKSLDLLASRVPLAACLLDAYVANEFGGTGTTVDKGIADCYLAQTRPRLVLAGGLNPDNVGGATADPRLWGVDTASGVESAPGIKDHDKVFAFVKAARQASARSTERL